MRRIVLRCLPLLFAVPAFAGGEVAVLPETVKNEAAARIDANMTLLADLDKDGKQELVLLGLDATESGGAVPALALYRKSGDGFKRTSTLRIPPHSTGTRPLSSLTPLVMMKFDDFGQLSLPRDKRTIPSFAFRLDGKTDLLVPVMGMRYLGWWIVTIDEKGALSLVGQVEGLEAMYASPQAGGWLLVGRQIRDYSIRTIGDMRHHAFVYTGEPGSFREVFPIPPQTYRQLRDRWDTSFARDPSLENFRRALGFRLANGYAADAKRWFAACRAAVKTGPGGYGPAEITRALDGYERDFWLRDIE